MSFQKRPYFLADIEPTIAIAEAVRWEREAKTSPVPAPTKPTSHNLMKEARAARAAYQAELLRRFGAFVGSLFFTRRPPLRGER